MLTNSITHKVKLSILLMLAALMFSGDAAAAEIKKKVARRAWLGLSLTDASEYQGFRKGKGIGSLGPLVTKVAPGGPADKAGIKPGDVILELNGTGTPNADSLVPVLRSILLGKAVPVRVVREGKILDLVMTIQSKVDFYHREAVRGDPAAQSGLARMYYEGQEVKKDYAQAASWYRKAAEQGDADGQYGLGLLYASGFGVRQDYSEALTWFRKAADRGNAEARNELGDSYRLGKGVPQDYAAALRWYRKAAELGLAEAQHNLGSMYDKGLGVEKSLEDAVRWYRMAVDQKYAPSYNSLGAKYEYGRGVPLDHVKAADYYRKAAEAGIPSAQKNLAYMYENGAGVPQDYDRATYWFRKAARQGNERAQKALEDLYAEGLAEPPPPAEVVAVSVKAEPEQVRIRGTVNLRLTYTVKTGDEGKTKVRESRTLQFEDEVLPNYPVLAERVREDGIYTTNFQQRIPSVARPGSYLYKGEVCMGEECISESVAFEVIK